VAGLRDPVWEISVLLAAARVHESRREHQRALRHAERAFGLVQHVDDDQLLADTLTCMGKQQLELGLLSDARRSSESAVQMHSESGDLEGQADVLINLGDILCAVGERGRAIDCYERSLALDRVLGDRYWEAYALNRLGDVHNAVGQAEIGIAAWLESLSIFEELGHLDAEALRRKIGTRQLGRPVSAD
jgi:tetratricopeptide (TPR) repeat protein